MYHSISALARVFVILFFLLSTLTTAVAAPVRTFNRATQATNHIPELAPRPGERRFNTNAFKVSHNAYEKPEEYYEQLDDDNSWGLELDIHWQDNQFEVYHDEVCLGRNMNDHIAVVTHSVTWREKVTVLWLQINDFGVCPLPDPNIYEPYIQNVIDQNFGWSHVYTPAEFQDIDQGRWPSWQELVRRGKNLIIVTERSPHPGRRWFFEVTYDRPTAPPVPGGVIWQQNQVFFNSGEFRAFPLPPEQSGDYWASRIYPDRWCGQIAGPAYETEDEWYVHVSTHATQVATNCMNTDWTQGRVRKSWEVHPPQPTFVVHDPIGTSQYGTHRFPYQGAGKGSYNSSLEGYQDGLLGAISRTSAYGSSTDIWIATGDYEMYSWEFVEFRGITINKPMVLKAINGPAVLH